MVFPTSAVVAEPVQAGAASIPGSVAGSVATTMLSLIVVLAVIFALAWLLRWMQGVRGGASGILRIHSGIQVGPKERVILLQAGDRHFLLGVAPGRVQTLHQFDQPPATGTSDIAAPALSPFAEKLRQLLQPKSPS